MAVISGQAAAVLTRPIPARVSRTTLALKRVFDLSIALVILPFVLVVIGLCAIAVRLDSPGPVFFVQRRTGRDGRRFGMIKFRTMVVDAEELKESLAYLNVLTPPDFKIPDDPRITRVGQLLRRTSFDELPQIFNVLNGTMSLVGPRPTSFSPETWELWHTKRLEVPPGITGLWQVSARNECEFDERLRLDIEYIDRMSLALDVKILFLTLGAVVRGTGE